MDGLTKLKTGDFNTMNQTWQPDGSVVIVLAKRGDDAKHRLHVRDLYGPEETVISDEVI